MKLTGIIIVFACLSAFSPVGVPLVSADDHTSTMAEPPDATMPTEPLDATMPICEYEGEIRELGDLWEVGSCITCTCLPFSVVNCVNRFEPCNVTCEENEALVLINGECCPICAELPDATMPTEPSDATMPNIDECLAAIGNSCSLEADCINTDGSFECVCHPGWIGDGITCTDIDECETDTDNCSPDGTCINILGSFYCACTEGFIGDGINCADRDECDEGTHNCSPDGICTNTDGSFFCACFDGYVGDGINCSDIDECLTATDNCSPQADCINTDGSFECVCHPGWSGDGVTCIDINECDDGTWVCGLGGSCNNTDGSYTCFCLDALIGDGINCAADVPTTTYPDIDECLTATDNCSPQADCINTLGSFECACHPGWSGDGVTCTDINECDDGTWVCGLGGSCNNTDGSYTCFCLDALIGDGIHCAADAPTTTYPVPPTTPLTPVSTTLRPNSTSGSCGGMFNATWSPQIVSTPGYPSQTANDLHCYYTFSVEEGSKIEMMINVSNVETCCDFVEILEDDVAIGKISGSRTNVVMISTRRNLTLHYHTDVSVLSGGFIASYRRLFTNCGETLTAENYVEDFTFSNGLISNENHPASQCLWTLEAPDFLPVLFTIDSFDVEDQLDHLSVYDGFNFLGKFSGMPDTPIKFVGKRLKLRLTTNNVRDTVFRVSYRIEEFGRECRAVNINCDESNCAKRPLCTTCPEGYVCCPSCCGTECMQPTNPNTTTVTPTSPSSFETTTASELCPPGVPLATCYSPPCWNASCPGVPNAICKNNYCGGCFANFTDQFGNSISEERCNQNNATELNLYCPEASSPMNQCDRRALWLCEYIRWRVTFLLTWQRAFNEWRTSNLPDLSMPTQSCHHLSVTCKDPSQSRVAKDFYQCQIPYCADGQYTAGPDLQVWQEDQQLWQRMYSIWKASLQYQQENTNTDCNL